MSLINMNLVTPKVGDELKLLFNKPGSGHDFVDKFYFLSPDTNNNYFLGLKSATALGTIYVMALFIV